MILYYIQKVVRYLQVLYLKTKYSDKDWCDDFLGDKKIDSKHRKWYV